MTDGVAGESGTALGQLPTVVAEVREDGTGELSVEGVVEHLRRDGLAEVGAAVTGRVAELAARLGVPVPVQVRDPDGLWSLVIHPDGRVDEAPSAAPASDSATSAADDDDASVPPWPALDAGAGAGDRDAPATPATGVLGTLGASGGAAGASTAGVSGAGGSATAAGAADAAPPASSSSPSTPGATRVGAPAPAPASLPTLEDLVSQRRERPKERAQQGWRRGIRLATFGLVRPGPGRAERAKAAAMRAVRRPLDGPRTIVVVNPKGGAHKTTATMLLATTFGLQRGGYTLAWDNNETHGTLGWRAAPSENDRTAVDLLRAIPGLAAGGTVRIGDLDGYVRTQREQFDVLASDENAASVATVDADSFRDLHHLLTQFYRVVVIDTGNNMRASNWRAAIDAADQLVVVSTVREDTSQSAAWALDALRAMGYDDVVRRAVTVLSSSSPSDDTALHRRLRAHFGALTRAVVDVPYDPALLPGGRIDYAALRPATRDAWLAAAAVVAEGL